MAKATPKPQPEPQAGLKTPPKAKPKNVLEERFLEILREESRRHNMELTLPHREYRFHPHKRYRFDFAWPAIMIAVEIEGAIWVRGRHNTGAGMLADMEKYNEAACLGWTVLRFASNHLQDSYEVYHTLMRAMGAFEADSTQGDPA